MTGPPRTIALLLESDGPGGAEQMLLDLAIELRGRGYDVCPVGPDVGYGWLPERLREAGFEPEFFHLRRPVDPACALGLARILRGRGVDVLHSHEFTMGVYGAAAGALIGRPQILTMHGGTRWAGARRRRIALRWAARRSSRLVAVSESTARFLEEHLDLPEGAVLTVVNGVPERKGSAEPVRRELHLGEDERLVLSVGNLYPVKGHDVLVRAAAELARRRPELRWRVAVAGRGEEEDELQSLAAELGIAGRLELLGYRADVADLLAAADVFVLPSRSEGLPLALLEAMFAGLPIVASNVGGIPEVVEDGEEALLVPVEDAGALAGALERLLTDVELARDLSDRARRRARKDYSVSAMAGRYVQLYREAVAG